jgi:hypothetical protein
LLLADWCAGVSSTAESRQYDGENRNAADLYVASRESRGRVYVLRVSLSLSFLIGLVVFFAEHRVA